MLIHCCEGIGRVFVRIIVRRPNQQHSTMQFPVPEHQFSKVLISRQKKRLFSACDFQYFPSSIPGEDSAMNRTIWPAARREDTVGPSTLSSATSVMMPRVPVDTQPTPAAPPLRTTVLPECPPG